MWRETVAHAPLPGTRIIGLLRDMAARDPYSVLGVSKTAKADDIKKAYRRLAKKYHPDQNKDPKAKDKFAEAAQAYEILGEDPKRQQFDRGEIDAEGKPRGFEGFPGGGFRPGGAGGGAGQSYEYESGPGGFRSRGAGGGFDAADIFSELFSGARKAGAGARSRQPQQPGEDLLASLTISLEESIRGATKRVAMQTGKALDVTIPAGMEDGKQVRLKGQGNPGPSGGPAGDALITVKVAAHPFFTVEGRHVRIDLPLTLYEAVLGGPVEVPTPTGRIELNVPAGASGGRTLRLRGKGLPASGSQPAGDLLVAMKIILPEASGSELEELMKKWRESQPYTPRTSLK